MKRIYACLVIVAALLIIAFYSSFRVQQFAEEISEDLDRPPRGGRPLGVECSGGSLR